MEREQKVATPDGVGTVVSVGSRGECLVSLVTGAVNWYSWFELWAVRPAVQGVN